MQESLVLCPCLRRMHLSSTRALLLSAAEGMYLGTAFSQGWKKNGSLSPESQLWRCLVLHSIFLQTLYPTFNCRASHWHLLTHTEPCIWLIYTHKVPVRTTYLYTSCCFISPTYASLHLIEIGKPPPWQGSGSWLAAHISVSVTAARIYALFCTNTTQCLKHDMMCTNQR